MESLYLVVDIAGERIALPADDVESVVEIEAITAVPLVAAHVAGLAALRSRVLTIIDSLAALELGRHDVTGASPLEPLQVVVVTVEGHLYGLLVDQVEDVVAISDPPRPVAMPLAAGWDRVARGIIEVDDETLLLIDPARLVTGPPALAA